MRKLFILFVLTLLGFVAVAQTAQAQVLQAPSTTDQARIAISPYAQAVPNDSYTFIGISHPSLDTAHTSIGVVLEVLDMTTVPNDAAGRSVAFTVDAGETHRVFIVNQSHATINQLNSAFSDARTHIITTVDSAQFGNIKVVGVNTTANKKISRSGYTPGTQSLSRLDNISQLDMWGVVFIPSSGTGFAMEFIGDAQDSTIGGNLTGGGETDRLGPETGVSTGAGRGIN
ncbi:MAG: hypothetical protein ACE5E9_07275 [Nitrospinaceae bacterium]